MLGAIIGDIIGSVHEFIGTKSVDFELFIPECAFTDDTVLTVAVADCLMTGASYADKLREYTFAYPAKGYGLAFLQWVHSGGGEPYGSWGNGSAMRVSPVGFFLDDLDSVLAEAKRSAEVTHDHPEGIKGAQATAAAIFMARSGSSKREIMDYISSVFAYDLNRTVEEIRPGYSFDVSCQGTVPEAIIAFLDSNGYEDAIRLAISLGGDADTLACIAGGIAEAFYGGIPRGIEERGLALLDDSLRQTVVRFRTLTRREE